MDKILTKDIKEADYNPRYISKESLEKLKNSIQVHSESIGNGCLRLVEPIIINKFNGVLVSGHQRLKAIQELGQDFIHIDDIRYVNIEDLNKEKSLNIILNNQEVAGDFDLPKLSKLIEEINIGGLDINKFTGYDLEEFTKKIDEINFDVVGIEEQGQLDVLDNPKKTVFCPDCGHEFTP